MILTADLLFWILIGLVFYGLYLWRSHHRRL
jgi:hypothetical protein